jgi:hypothetical protein
MGNSVKFLTRDKGLLTRPFVPNQPLFTDDIEGIRELSGQKQVFPEMSLSGLLQAGAERVSGQGDPNFGRETRMGGHPQPATNFLGQQANSQILNTLPMKSLRMAVGKMGEHRSIMYQQFEKNRGGWLASVFDEDDAIQIMEVLEDDQVVTGSVRFDIHALSEMHNPDAERQKTVLIDQVFTNYVTQVAKMLEVIENPQSQQMPMLREHLTQAISAKGETLTRFLESSDVDNIEEYIFKLKEAQGGDIDTLRQLAAQVGGAGPEGAAGGPGGPIPGPGLAAVPGGAGQGQAPPPGPGAGDLLYGA